MTSESVEILDGGDFPWIWGDFWAPMGPLRRYSGRRYSLAWLAGLRRNDNSALGNNYSRLPIDGLTNENDLS